MSLDFPAFALTEEHQELRAAVRALADDKIAPRAAEVDESGEFPWDVHCGQLRPGQGIVHVPGELARLVHLRRPRRDLVVGEGAHGCPQCLMLLGQRERGKVKAHGTRW